MNDPDAFEDIPLATVRLSPNTSMASPVAFVPLSHDATNVGDTRILTGERSN